MLVIVSVPWRSYMQVYWPLSQDHQNKLGDKSNLECRLFIQTVQNNNVYRLFLCLNNI